MTAPDPMTTARDRLDALHLQANDHAPTQDHAAARRRAARLWDAARHPGAGTTVLPWHNLNPELQDHVADVVTRALADVLEVEQALYTVLAAELEHQEERRDVAQAVLAAEPGPDTGELCVIAEHTIRRVRNMGRRIITHLEASA